MDILNFIFESVPHFVGTLILIMVTGFSIGVALEGFSLVNIVRTNPTTKDIDKDDVITVNDKPIDKE